MKILFLLAVGLVLASMTVGAADWKIGGFTLLSSRVHHANDPVLESKLPPVRVPRKEIVVDLGASHQVRYSQGTTRSVSTTPLPGDHQEVVVSQVATVTSTVSSRTPDPYYPVLVNGKAPQGAYVQRVIPLVPLAGKQ